MYRIMPITVNNIQSFNAAVDSIARERLFLSFLQGPSLAMTEQFVKANLADNWPIVIALNGETVIGWCDVTALNRPIYEHVGRLGLGVLKPYRGQGLGKKLMEAALTKAREKGLTRIELTVREQNLRAIKLYKSLGFQIEGIHQNAVKIDAQYENNLTMALLLEDKN